ncbi:hypothetical protein STCU_11444 [Strigomonas culicis]|uniref:Uncharacterized protein n=1 Tax=Strigomonas culicis TaxID=28005 RepID=S9UNK9_9TRYP|nr:hypothetical protein STCU_11444 [Strigomonas culicis]|eukprot:EPY16261.1 hypothetical protein STCU_11444 [Strigomonas culicis]
MRRLGQQCFHGTFGGAALACAGPATLLPLSWPTLLYTAWRPVASYPTPHRSHTRTASSSAKKKKFNYLTPDRLVANNRRKLSKNALRARDDKSLARRRNYRRLLLQDVETKIHFFSPLIKKHVFFPSNKFNAKLLFRGNRLLVTHTFTRIYVSVIDQLKQRQHRDTLVSLMREAGVEPPTAEEWARYTDRKTGDINIGLLHSVWLKRYFVEVSRKGSALLEDDDRATRMRFTPTFLYVAVHFKDIPTLEDWSHKKGKLQVRELELTKDSRALSTVQLSLANAKGDIASYGTAYVEEHVNRMTTDQVGAVETTFRSEAARILQDMNAQLAFTAKVLLGAGELPEVKAIQSPMTVYFNRCELLSALAQKGSPHPPFKRNFADWHQLPKEERDRCYCFARKPERITKTGMQLFFKYCSRDYGILRSEATRKYHDLTDLQQAALSFPFYLPITPQRSGAVAFRKFYGEMCARYGLIRGGHATFGNRLFEAAMRKKWLALDPVERQQYDENDAIAAAFPLQPGAGKARGRDATAPADEDEAIEQDVYEEGESELEEEDEEDVEEEVVVKPSKRKGNVVHIV